MRKFIHAIYCTLVISCITFSMQSCTSNATETTSKANLATNTQTDSITLFTNDVQVYYFHATRRCATCEAVESVTLEALKEYYGTAVPFQSIDRDEDKQNPLLTQYKVNGQTLLVIKDGKAVNLTTDAFLNARTKPEKLKEKIKSTIDTIEL